MPAKAPKSKKTPARTPAPVPAPVPAPGPARKPILPGQAIRSQEPEEGESELLFPEATSETRIRVGRLDDFTQKEVLHGYLNHVEQTELKVAELWGGGNYKVYLLGPDERGSMVVRRKRDFKLLGPYRMGTGIYGMPTPSSVGAPAAPAGVVVADPRIPVGSTAKELVESALLGKVLDLMEQKNKTTPALDWTPIITGVLGFIEVLVKPKQDPQASAIAEELRQLRGELDRMRHQPGPATHSITDVLGAVEQLANAKKLLSGGGDDDGERSSSLTGLLAPILQILAKGGTVPAASVPSPSPQPAGDPGPLWTQLLRHYGRDFIGAAQRNIEPAFVADMAVRFVPSEHEGVLFEFVQRPDAAQVAMEVIPPLKQFPTWTAKVFEELKLLMQEEESEAEVEGQEE